MNPRNSFSWQRYVGWLNHYLDDRRSAVNWQEPQRLKTLLAASIITLLASLVLYSTGGYHAGFHSLQAISDDAPAGLLANITFLGDTVFALCVLAVIAWRYPSAVWVGLLAAVVAGAINTVMKKQFGTLRPPGVLSLDEMTLIGVAAKKTAFPSGHTATAFALASVLLFVAKGRSMQVMLMAMATLIGLSRVFVGVHWPVDLGVGAAVGMLCVWGSAQWNARTRKRVHPYAHLMMVALLLAACVMALWHTGGYPRAVYVSCTAGALGIAVLLWGYVIKPVRELSK